MRNDLLGPLARKVARRYVAGEGLSDAMERATEIQTRGHCVNLEYVAKSYRGPAPCGRRDPGVPRGGPSAPGRLLSIAGPLPHRAGDRSGLTLDNAILIAQSTATRGREMVIFAAGSERTDAVVWIHERLCARFDHVSVTVQARLHRTASTSRGCCPQPGRIRLVKGAFPEPEKYRLLP